MVKGLMFFFWSHDELEAENALDYSAPQTVSSHVGKFCQIQAFVCRQVWNKLRRKWSIVQTVTF